jgi:hypothetical protein
MKDNQHEQLFTELTSAEAAVIEGGAEFFGSSVRFDQSLDSRVFDAPAGNFRLRLTNVRDRGDGSFNVGLVQVKTFYDEPKGRRAVATRNGSSTDRWDNQPAGRYKLLFRDQRDNRFVDADFVVETV